MSQQTPDLVSDVVFQINGDKHPCVAGPILRETGWRGGLWVRFVPPTSLVEEYVVEASDGNEVAGFLGFPSENYAPGSFSGPVNNYTGAQLRTEQGSVSGASTVTMTAGGGRMLFLMFETEALTGGGVREGGPITYALNEVLKVSENGYLCNDSDLNLGAAGVTTPQIVGRVCAVPHARNGFRLGLQLNF